MPVTKITSKWVSGELVFYYGSTEVFRVSTTGPKSAASFISGEKFTVTRTLVANADFPIPIFIAPAPCYLVSCYEAHVTKSTTGQTAQLELLTAGTAPGSGTGMLNASIALDITNNTPQTVVAGATVSNLTTGETCALRTSGSGATYAGGTFVATFQWV